jgi:hypothetical protein
MTHPFLRAMTAGEIVVAGLRVYRDHFRLLMLVALLPHLALLALELLLMAAGAGGDSALLAVMVAMVVANAIALAALTVATGRAAQGQEPSLVEVYAQTARSRLGAVMLAYLAMALVASVGMMLLIVPGMILLIVPGIALGALFAPVVPVIVLERLGALEGIARSVRLVRPHWLKGMVAFSWFILVAVFLPLYLLFLQVRMGTGPFTPLLSAIIGSVTLPLGFTSHVVLYISLRADEAGAEAQLAAALDTTSEVGRWSGGRDRSQGVPTPGSAESDPSKTGQSESKPPIQVPSMSAEEARAVLNVGPEATEDEIQAAYRRLMAKVHPDHEGSTWMAKKINEAKAVLLEK